MRNQISNDSANSGPASDFNGLSRREFLKIGAAAAAGWLMTACQGSTPTPATVDTPTPLGSSPIPIDEYPMGIGRGIFPGRVSWAHNRSATRWDGSTGYWWQPEYTDRSAVAEMLSQSLHIQTGQATDTDAWEALFTHFNQARGR